MTREEIKEMYSMRDIASMYGIQANRAGFIQCPFHQGDRTPSMKLYDRDFHCHACGANGDIFDFVQRMDNVTFKEAFQLLGGEYKQPTFSTRIMVYKAKKQREMKRKEAERLRDRKRLNHTLIGIYRAYMDRSEPLSDVWTDCYNKLQYQLYLQAELNGMEARW